MIKRYCICTCVPAKKDSQHKGLFLSNGFFFKVAEHSFAGGQR